MAQLLHKPNAQRLTKPDLAAQVYTIYSILSIVFVILLVVTAFITVR